MRSNAGPQPLSPSGARLSPHQLSFMFLASPFMSFLLAFFHLSPGQAPNWKTETQKPRQALESQSCPEKEAAALRGKSQIPECERECKLTGSRLPHTLGSCSDLHTLKNSQGSSAHTVLSYRSVFFSFQDREKRRGKKSLFRLQNHCLADLKLHFPWVCSSQSTSFCYLRYYFGRGTGPKYFEANKCFKNQPLPQGTLGNPYSEVV